MSVRSVDYYELESLFSDAEIAARDTLRDFLEKGVRPLVTRAFQHEEPLALRLIAPRLGSLGVIGPFIPPEYGGQGSNYMTFGLICQEMERVDSALRSFMAVESGLVMYPIWQYGSEVQKQRWLPLLAAGQAIGCFGLTEPDHGSDINSIETRAEKSGDSWIVNGAKQWISEAHIADFALVWAKVEGVIMGFLVERGTPGFEQNFQKNKGSMRAGDVGELVLSDCRVPADNVLPKSGGMKSPLSCLNQARYGIAWGAVGAAVDCYETALAYVKERKQFGKSLASFQLVQEKLAGMLIEITKAQLVAFRLGQLMDAGKATPPQISLAKKNNVTTARLCARTAREMLGANGISLEYSPIRHMANIESVYTYEGTDDIHTLILGQSITGVASFM